MQKLRSRYGGLFRFASLLLLPTIVHALDADLVLINGKIVAVDNQFSIQNAMAIRGGLIFDIGSEVKVFAARGPKTKVINLGGKMVLPGLIDSHAHAAHACLTEFDHSIPEMESISDVLN